MGRLKPGWAAGEEAERRSNDSARRRSRGLRRCRGEGQAGLRVLAGEAFGRDAAVGAAPLAAVGVVVDGDLDASSTGDDVDRALQVVAQEVVDRAAPLRRATSPLGPM